MSGGFLGAEDGFQAGAVGVTWWVYAGLPVLLHLYLSGLLQPRLA